MDAKRSIETRLAKARNMTLWLMEQVPEEFWNRRVHEFYSPIGWHFGHIGRTEEHWACTRAMGRGPLSEDLDFLYTDCLENPKDARVRVPNKLETRAYLDATRAFALDSLATADFADADPLVRDGYAWEFALQHECQHQETICEMLSLIHLAGTKFEPARTVSAGGPSFSWTAHPGGKVTLGSSDPFVYDNEREPHELEVDPFEITRRAVSVSQWRAFIGDQGYDRPDLWSEEGWAWRQSERADRPFGWASNLYEQIGPQGVRGLDEDAPVTGVSWFEAEAFARWAGARLPSEAEWTAACGPGPYPWGLDEPTRDHANFGIRDWGPTAPPKAGSSPYGVEGLAGGSWEWTSSLFLPFPGFVAYPYDGYSKAHMDGKHRVCKGGSWATAGLLLRKSFRNWYVPGYRQGFLGVRLAR